MEEEKLEVFMEEPMVEVEEVVIEEEEEEAKV